MIARFQSARRPGFFGHARIAVAALLLAAMPVSASLACNGGGGGGGGGGHDGGGGRDRDEHGGWGSDPQRPGGGAVIGGSRATISTTAPDGFVATAGQVALILPANELAVMQGGVPADFPAGDCTNRVGNKIKNISAEQAAFQEENQGWPEKLGRHLTAAERAEEIKQIVDVLDRIPAGQEFLDNIGDTIAVPDPRDSPLGRPAVNSLAQQIQGHIDLVAERDALVDAIAAEYNSGPGYADRVRALRYRQLDVNAALAVQQTRITDALVGARVSGEAAVQAHAEAGNRFGEKVSNFVRGLGLSALVNVVSSGVGILSAGTGPAGFGVSVVVGGVLNYALGGGQAAATNTVASGTIEAGRLAIPRGTSPAALAVSVGYDAVAAAAVQAGLDQAVADPAVGDTVAEAMARDSAHNGNRK